VKLIYIAGPYTAPTPEGVAANIERARKAACRCIERGWAVICPHTNSAGMDKYGHEYWYAADLEMLGRCDAMYVLLNYERSRGTLAEIRFARENGIMIFYEGDNLIIPKPSYLDLLHAEEITAECERAIIDAENTPADDTEEMT
jgi:nucleoside 2-deoxyribosyltransferase